MKNQRKWVIRGFDVMYIENDEHGITDSISSLNNFTEIVADNIVDMFEQLNHSSLCWMRLQQAIHLQKNHNCVVTNERPKNEFYMMKISLVFNNDYETIRANKHALIETVKKWAEKRTAKYNSLSGWRLNAIKDPIFEKIGHHCYKMTFDVLLSNVIWFTGNRVTISDKASIPSYVSNDVAMLVNMVTSNCPNLQQTYHKYKLHDD